MLKQNHSLLNHNTFGFDVEASYFFEYETESELCNFLLNRQKEMNPIFHIGAGSNLLFLGNFRGTILHSAIRYIKEESRDSNNVLIRVGSGVEVDDFCKFCVDNKFGGLENLSLIPGEIGAAAVQNIGAYGSEIRDSICSVEAIEIDSLQKKNFDVEECEYSYRNSIFKSKLRDRYIVLSVVFCLKLKDYQPNTRYDAVKKELEHIAAPSISDVRDAVAAIRKRKLPDTNKLGNAGSFFKNPYCGISQLEKLKTEYPDISHYMVDKSTAKIAAAWLIEQCGWKGKVVGNVGAYSLQPLVLVNYGGATPSEIVDLSKKIQESVEDKFSLRLEPEVLFVS